jgi:hypothetical protein
VDERYEPAPTTASVHELAVRSAAGLRQDNAAVPERDLAQPRAGAATEREVRTVTVAAKITFSQAKQLERACEEDGVTRSAFLQRALVDALRRRRGDIDIDLAAEEDAGSARSTASST